MNNQEKIKLLEEMLELDGGMLQEATVLADLDEWDSMASLSLIVLMDEEFNKKITGKQIKNFRTIKDVLDFMR